MFVIIAGGGRTGAELAKSLLAEGHRVKIIEERPEVVERLQEDIGEELVLCGESSSPATLEKAGIYEAQVLAAVTREDEANLVVATLARFEFGVPRVIARVNNPKNAWLFTPEMGVDVALNPAALLSKLIIEEISLGDMMTLLKLRRGEYSIVEEKVHPNAIAVGKSLRDMNLPAHSRVVAILRKGQLIVPDGNTVLEAVDEVICLAHASQLGELAHLLGHV